MRFALPFWRHEHTGRTRKSRRNGGRGYRRSLRERSLSLEPLETRELLSVCHWDGGGNDDYWTTAANWQGDVAPVAGDDLVFEGTTRTSTQNNFAAGTSFHSIEFASDDFSLAGNNFTLTSGITVDSGISNATISMGIALSGPTTINVNDTSLTASGVLSGGGNSLTKTGAGALVVTANNTYTGTMVIDAGTLQVGDGGTTGVHPGTSMVNNGSLVFERSDSLAVGNTISGTGSITQSGTGLINLIGNNTYTGGTAILSGVLSFAQGSLGPSGAITIAGDSTLKWYGGNTQDISGRLVLEPDVNATLNIDGGYSVTFASGFGGGNSASITKIGTGRLTLAQNNAYTGTTTISAGTLQIGAGGGTGSLGAGNITNNATLEFQRSDLVELSSVISGTGNLRQSGSGTLSLTGNNTYTGTTSVYGGTLEFVSGSLGPSGNIYLSGTSTLKWSEGNTQDISSRLRASGTIDATLDVGGNNVTFASGTGGTGTLLKAGSGTLTVTGTNYYTNVTILAGTLQVGAGGTTGWLSVGSIANNASLVFDRADQITFYSAISGTGSITKNGTNWLLLSGNNTFTGGVTVNSGTLAFTSGALGSTGAITVAGNVTLVWNGTNTDDISGRLMFAEDVTTTLAIGNNNVPFATAFGNGSAASITKTGLGTLTLTGDNTYTGGTRINAGTVAFASGGLASSGSVTVGGTSTIQWLDGNSEDISGRLVLSNGVITTLAIGNNDVTLATAFGTGSTAAITKTGEGALTLTGNNAYTGGTRINAGTVAFANGGLGGSGTITMGGAATVRWLEGNTQDISNRLSLNGMNVTLDVGGNNVTLASGMGGGSAASVTKAGTGAVTLTGWNSYTGGTIVSAGTLQVGAGGTSGVLPAGGITNDGLLIFDRSDNVTWSNLIGGTGNLVKNGAGTLTLTGNSTYTGLTTINAGKLQVGSGGSTGTLGSGAVMNNGAIVFNRTGTVEISGEIGGTGGVTKQNTGVVILSGNSTYTGVTTVSQGELSVTGGIPFSTVIIGGGATLSGTWAAALDRSLPLVASLLRAILVLAHSARRISPWPRIPRIPSSSLRML